MEVSPRQVAFIADEMERIENSEDRYPSVQREAAQLREQAEAVLTE